MSVLGPISGEYTRRMKNYIARGERKSPCRDDQTLCFANEPSYNGKYNYVCCNEDQQCITIGSNAWCFTEEEVEAARALASLGRMG